MMILLYSSLATFGLPSTGSLTMIFCSSCVDTCNNNFSFFSVTVNGDVKTILYYCRLHNLRMVYNTIAKGFLGIFVYFCMTAALCNFYHNTLTALIALWFALAAPNLRTTILCLKSNASGIWQSDFLTKGFVVGSVWMGEIGLFLFHPYGVENIDDWRMAFNCCWYSHIPAVLYNFLMISRHLCS